MILDALIVVMLFVVMGVLAYASYGVFAHKVTSRQLNRSLFLRACLSIALLVFVVVSYTLGWLDPSDTIGYL